MHSSKDVMDRACGKRHWQPGGKESESHHIAGKGTAVTVQLYWHLMQVL
jgi:hypothetical protein